MKIKPSILTIIYPSVFIFILSFILLIISLTIFDGRSSFIQNSILALSISIFLFLIPIFSVFIYSIIEKIEVNGQSIVLYRFGKKIKELHIDQIIEVEEHIKRNFTSSGYMVLVLKSKSKEKLEIFYKRYQEQDIENLLNYLQKLNLNIKNSFKS